MPLSLTSSAFRHHGEIPSRYTCEGDDISPPLSWSGAPEGTESSVLVVDDPDAPDPRARDDVGPLGLYNLPSTIRAVAGRGDARGAAHGRHEGRPRTTGSGRLRRPSLPGPDRRHRYFLKLYALDTVLPDLRARTKSQLEQAMKGHLLGRAELIGTYQKQAR